MAFGFLKKLAGGITDFASRPVRGIGRVLRGNFREGFGDIGYGIKRGAQMAALLGSGGTLAPFMAAGGGMLERGMGEGAGIGNVLRAGVGGASGAMAARGVGNIRRSMLSRGGQTAVGQAAAGQVAGQTAGQAAGSAMPSIPGAERYLGRGIGRAAGAVAENVSGGGLGRIGEAIGSAGGWMERHPAGLQFAGTMLSGRAEMGLREDQQQYYLDMLDQRREEEEYNRSREKLLRDMIISGTWRGR